MNVSRIFSNRLTAQWMRREVKKMDNCLIECDVQQIKGRRQRGYIVGSGHRTSTIQITDLTGLVRTRTIDYKCYIHRRGLP